MRNYADRAGAIHTKKNRGVGNRDTVGKKEMTRTRGFSESRTAVSPSQEGKDMNQKVNTGMVSEMGWTYQSNRKEASHR